VDSSASGKRTQVGLTPVLIVGAQTHRNIVSIEERQWASRY
jgi:hypothetical protein